MARDEDRPQTASSSRLIAVAFDVLTGRTGAWLFTAALAIAAVVVFVLFIVPAPAYEPEEALPWPIFALGFGLAEVAVVHLMIRSQAVTVSLSEVPLVVGFYFLAPAYLVVAQFVGAGLALVVHRRQPPLKLAFNLASFSLASSLAILVFRQIVPIAPSSLLVWWVGALMGAGTVVVAGAVAISIVMSLSQRRVELAALRGGLGFGLVTAFVNTSFALVAADFLRTNPDELWLLGAPAAVGLLGYRLFSAQRQRQARLFVPLRMHADPPAAAAGRGDAVQPAPADPRDVPGRHGRGDPRRLRCLGADPHGGHCRHPAPGRGRDRGRCRGSARVPGPGRDGAAARASDTPR